MQSPLFPDPATEIALSPDRREPNLWVRRLAIWSKPDVIIRDVAMRRGMNIVWSPDPGAPAADLGADATSGHGVGKTLFCRLLRFCLGEETFANDELRQSIAVAFPEGWVGAEVVVGGSAWGVARPIGMRRSVLAIEGACPEQLVGSESRHTGIAPLTDAIGRLLPGGLDARIPGQRPAKAWLFALAWMARDQECRLGHLLDWRDPRADTRSVLPAMAKDDVLVVVRHMLDAMSATEDRHRENLGRVQSERASVERDIAFLARTVERLWERVRSDLELDGGLATAGPLGVTAARTAADRLLDAVDKAALGPDAGTEVGPLRSELDDVIGAVAVHKKKKEETEGILAFTREQLRVLAGEQTNLSADEIKATLGPFCPVCKVPIEEALAEGCNLSVVRPDRADVAANLDANQQSTRRCRESIARLQGQVQEHEAILDTLEDREKKLRGQIRQAEAKLEEARKAHRLRWREAARVSDDVTRLETAINDEQSAQRRLHELATQDAKLKDRIQSGRQRHRAIMDRFEELFQYVCHGLLGAGVESHLKLTGQGLKAEVQRGGAAMESVKALAFDLAALLMTIEGRSGLPALWIHDSPREADLGLSHYHRLFRFIARLEKLSATPPFQYIVTTTTEPPDEFKGADYVVARLEGDRPEGRLLGRAL